MCEAVAGHRIDSLFIQSALESRFIGRAHPFRLLTNPNLDIVKSLIGIFCKQPNHSRRHRNSTPDHASELERQPGKQSELRQRLRMLDHKWRELLLHEQPLQARHIELRRIGRINVGPLRTSGDDKIESDLQGDRAA